MKTVLLAATAVFLLAGAAYAQGVSRVDTNGDGRVTLTEFKAKRLDMMMKADTNHDGKLSQAELEASRAMRANHGGGDAPGTGHGGRMFAMMDANHDGFLDKAEIGKLLERRFQRLDVDGDGVISASEAAAAKAQRPMGGQGGGL